MTDKEVLEWVNEKIVELEDDLQHYTMVEKDKCREFYIREDLKQFKAIKKDLEVFEILKEHIISFDTDGFLVFHISNGIAFDYFKKEWLENDK